MSQCPSCGGQSTDDLLCWKETSLLEHDLRSLPALLRELQTNLTRQNQSGTGAGIRTKDTVRPLPYDKQASEVGWVVQNTLTTWCRELSFDDLHCDNTARSMALWLLARIERIRGHAAAAEIADEIGYCVKQIRHVIDTRPERLYLGPCQTRVEDGTCHIIQTDGTSRNTQLYAPAGSEAYDCPECGQPVNVATRRKELLDSMADQHATVGKCAGVLGIFGLEVKADTVANWARPRTKNGTTYPPKLWSTGVNSDGHKLYRIGDVVTLIHEAIETKVNRRRKVS